MQSETSLWQDPDTDTGKLYLAGFKAALADNLYDTKIGAASTVETYHNQVVWVLKQHNSHQLSRAVSRGVGKSLQDGKRYQGSLDLSFFTDLYSIVGRGQNDFLNVGLGSNNGPRPQDELRLIRNLLCYSFLGFTISRSQAAVVKRQQTMQGGTTTKYLPRKNVRFDKDRYCIWWALTFSKGDPFGKRKGKDRKDWTVTAGSRSPSHPIDIVKLYILYCQMMGFDSDPNSKLSRQQEDAPFFQQLDHAGRPTGAAFTYDSLLKELKSDIVSYFPNLDPADYATHSFRRFGATYAFCKGIPSDLVQYMGRWVSDCWQRYLLFSDDNKTDMSHKMLY